MRVDGGGGFKNSRRGRSVPRQREATSTTVQSIRDLSDGGARLWTASSRKGTWKSGAAEQRLDIGGLARRPLTAEVREDRESGLIPSGDGDFAYRQALRAEREALAEYAKALRELHRLIVEKKLPEGDGAPIDAATFPPEMTHPAGTLHFRCLCGERIVIGRHLSAYTTRSIPSKDRRGRPGSVPHVNCFIRFRVSCKCMGAPMHGSGFSDQPGRG